MWSLNGPLILFGFHLFVPGQIIAQILIMK